MLGERYRYIIIQIQTLFARTNMFKLNLGQDTAHSLTEENFRELGQRTEGYSGADVALVVRDALMQVRMQDNK